MGCWGDVHVFWMAAVPRPDGSVHTPWGGHCTCGAIRWDADADAVPPGETDPILEAMWAASQPPPAPLTVEKIRAARRIIEEGT